jgi:hypothetical protein
VRLFFEYSNLLIQSRIKEITTSASLWISQQNISPHKNNPNFPLAFRSSCLYYSTTKAIHPFEVRGGLSENSTGRPYRGIEFHPKDLQLERNSEPGKDRKRKSSGGPHRLEI